MFVNKKMFKHAELSHQHIQIFNELKGDVASASTLTQIQQLSKRAVMLAFVRCLKNLFAIDV